MMILFLLNYLRQKYIVKIYEKNAEIAHFA